MGVTLERVQNKFACIIGELCNEPLVLSQFAVWVDLRIAEYKTNGKISLDCSGDSPNPPWMKGVKNERHRLGSNSVDTGQSGSHRGRGGYTSPGGSPLYSDRVHMPESPRLAHVNSHQAYSSRLSPDVMVIKDEPSLDSQSLCAGGRKRLSDSGDFQSDFHSPSKSARLGNTSLTLSTPQESSSNQSLMSIINAETDSVVLEQVDAADSDIFRSSVSELDVSHGSTSSNPTFSPQRHHTNSSSPASQSTWANQFGQSTQSSSSHTAGHVTDPNDENGPSNSSGYTLDPGYAGPCLNPSTRDDTLDPGYAGPCLNPSTRDEFKRRKSATSMRIFEKWLRYSATETRRAVNIPSAELSSYLVRFFKEVKKQNGQDYTVKSLDSLRDSIKMYLQAANYGHCIVSSPDFFRSQISYRIRRRQLFLKGAAGQQSSECGSDL